MKRIAATLATLGILTAAVAVGAATTDGRTWSSTYASEVWGNGRVR